MTNEPMELIDDLIELFDELELEFPVAGGLDELDSILISRMEMAFPGWDEETRAGFLMVVAVRILRLARQRIKTITFPQSEVIN